MFEKEALGPSVFEVRTRLQNAIHAIYSNMWTLTVIIQGFTQRMSDRNCLHKILQSRLVDQNLLAFRVLALVRWFVATSILDLSRHACADINSKVSYAQIDALLFSVFPRIQFIPQTKWYRKYLKRTTMFDGKYCNLMLHGYKWKPRSYQKKRCMCCTQAVYILQDFTRYIYHNMTHMFGWAGTLGHAYVSPACSMLVWKWNKWAPDHQTTCLQRDADVLAAATPKAHNVRLSFGRTLQLKKSYTACVVVQTVPPVDLFVQRHLTFSNRGGCKQLFDMGQSRWIRQGILQGTLCKRYLMGSRWLHGLGLGTLNLSWHGHLTKIGRFRLGKFRSRFINRHGLLRLRRTGLVSLGCLLLLSASLGLLCFHRWWLLLISCRSCLWCTLQRRNLIVRIMKKLSAFWGAHDCPLTWWCFRPNCRPILNIFTRNIFRFRFWWFGLGFGTSSSSPPTSTTSPWSFLVLLVFLLLSFQSQLVSTCEHLRHKEDKLLHMHVHRIKNYQWDRRVTNQKCQDLFVKQLYS